MSGGCISALLWLLGCYSNSVALSDPLELGAVCWTTSSGKLKMQLQQLRAGQSIPVESLDETLLTMP